MCSLSQCLYLTISLIVLTDTGYTLECYYCSGKSTSDCADPFPSMSNSSSRVLVNCSTLRTRALNTLNVYHSLLHNMTGFRPLGPEPHVCFKYYDGDFPIRGCSQNDFCLNFTSTICELCDKDGCNLADSTFSPNKMFAIIFSIVYHVLACVL